MRTKEGWLIDEYTDNKLNQESMERCMMRTDSMPRGYCLDMTVRRSHRSVNWMR